MNEREQILRAALEKIAARAGYCIYRRDENGGVAFREGSNAAYEECAQVAKEALERVP